MNTTQRTIVISADGEIRTHIAESPVDYATLCGMDGNDQTSAVDQRTLPDAPRAKIDCEHCRRIWEIAKNYRKSDFK